MPCDSVLAMLGPDDEPWFLVTDVKAVEADAYVHGFWLERKQPTNGHQCFVRWKVDGADQDPVHVWKSSCLFDISDSCVNVSSKGGVPMWKIPNADYDECKDRQRWERSYLDYDNCALVQPLDPSARRSVLSVSADQFCRWESRLSEGFDYAKQVRL